MSPTQLIWGERDAMIPVANSQDNLKGIANARLASFAGSGHLPQEEAGAESVAAVEQFLAQP